VDEEAAAVGSCHSRGHVAWVVEEVE